MRISRLWRRLTAGGTPPTTPERHGSLAMNAVDGKLWGLDPAGIPVVLTGVLRFRSEAAYAAGDVVYYAGMLWVAAVTITPGAFDVTKWARMGTIVVQDAEPTNKLHGMGWLQPSSALFRIWDATGTPAWRVASAGDRILRAGDAMTGPLGLSVYTDPEHAVSKGYVDAADGANAAVLSSISASLSSLLGTVLFRTGGEMEGPLVVAEPQGSTEAATKNYVDALVYIGDNPPTDPRTKVWFRTTQMRLFIEIGDQWIDAAPAAPIDPAWFLSALNGGEVAGLITARGGLYVEGNFFWQGFLVPAIKRSYQNSNTNALSYYLDRRGEFARFWGRAELTSAAPTKVITLPFALKAGYDLDANPIGVGTVNAPTTQVYCDKVNNNGLTFQIRANPAPAVGTTVVASWRAMGQLLAASDITA